VNKKANMRKTLLIIAAIGIFSIASFAQAKNDTIQQLQNSIENLEGANIKFSGQLNTANSNIQKIEKELSTVADSLNILKDNLAITNKNLQTIADNLGVQIQQTNEKTSAELSNLSETVSKNTLYWIIAVLLLALLSVLLFGWLKKQLSKEKSGLSDQIKKASDLLREDQLKLDGQLIKLLDTQMQLMNEERKSLQPKSEDIDHSLALKIADEVVRIQMNLSNMDQNVKGISNLKNRVTAIMDNFIANGYEIVDLLNKPYDQGMNLVATMEPDDNLEPGKQIIKRIIKPQINFKGQMIQAAQVVVAYGE